MASGPSGRQCCVDPHGFALSPPCPVWLICRALYLLVYLVSLNGASICKYETFFQSASFVGEVCLSSCHDSSATADHVDKKMYVQEWLSEVDVSVLYSAMLLLAALPYQKMMTVWGPNQYCFVQENRTFTSFILLQAREVISIIYQYIASSEDSHSCKGLNDCEGIWSLRYILSAYHHLKTRFRFTFHPGIQLNCICVRAGLEHW